MKKYDATRSSTVERPEVQGEAADRADGEQVERRRRR